MLAIDGAQKSGSGTIVRYAVALAALVARPVRVFNARRKRSTPGLRPQHVTGILAAAATCDGRTEGVSVGSMEFTFAPSGRVAGGTCHWDIGTAGSATMLALSILPLACFADRPLTARLEGSVFQDFAPSPHHLQHALAPLLRRMGAAVSVQVIKPGYVPRARHIALYRTVRNRAPRQQPVAHRRIWGARHPRRATGGHRRTRPGDTAGVADR